MAPVARHEYDFSRAIEGGETIVDGNDIDTAPRNVHSLSLDIELGPSSDLDEWHLVLEGTHVGHYFLDAANTATYPGHDVANLRLAWNPSGPLRADLRVDNLFDKLYADRADFAFGNYRYFPARGRAVFSVSRLRQLLRGIVGWIIYIVSGLLSLGLIVHCIKTGRNTIWVYVLVVLISFPFIGSLVYFGAEILPELLRSRTSQRAMRGIRTTLDPEGNLRKLETEVKVTGNVASRQRYADELVRLGRAAEALPIYQTCLTGVFQDDPKLLLGYAHAQFEAGDATAARKTLDDLIQRNPDFKSAGWAPAVRARAGSRGRSVEGVVRVRNAGGVLPGSGGRRALREIIEQVGPGATGPADAESAAGPGQIRTSSLSQGPA